MQQIRRYLASPTVRLVAVVAWVIYTIFLILVLCVNPSEAKTRTTRITHAEPRHRTTRVTRPEPREKKVYHDCAPILAREEESGHPDFEPLIIVHNPQCQRVWLNPDEVGGLRELPPDFGAPWTKTEVFFHEDKVFYVWEDPDTVAKLIPGLVLFHTPHGQKEWLKAAEIMGARYTIPGILGNTPEDKLVKTELFMKEITSKYVVETPEEVAAAIAAVLRQK